MTDLKQQILQMGALARQASYSLSQLSTPQKNNILLAMANGLRSHRSEIFSANTKDLNQANNSGLSPAMQDRLMLNESRLEKIAVAIEEVAQLPDPSGEILEIRQRPNGLKITKIRVPIGVIGIIFESRPNVTADAAALCFKTGNATLLRGGSEAIHSNIAIAQAMQSAGLQAGLPEGSIQLIDNTDRAGVEYLAQMDQYLDLIIPRGGKALIEKVVSAARMPVIKHYDGVCHIYVHEDADLDMATNIILNSKCQKPSVCNALETILIHESLSDTYLPKLSQALAEAQVIQHAEPHLHKFLTGKIETANDATWFTEYLNLACSIKTVSSLDAAIVHINHYGSHHTDSIITGDPSKAESFLSRVDSAVVIHNAATRFNDGGEFGFGAEIGISTDKLHARGPMGLAELCSYKYQIQGQGQIRQ
jgi:glutamate-5-semialdehyde dehydrogenase